MPLALPRLPGSERGAVASAGLALALLVNLALGALAIYERDEALDARSERAEMLARVLDDHAARSFETVSVALSSLADALAPEAGARGSQIGWALTQALASVPLLRGLAVLDAQGTVLASNEPSDIGRRVDLSRLGVLPPVGQDAAGSFVPGRGLAALMAAGARTAPRGVGVIPMVRRLQTRAGQGLLIVGLINPDAIANQQQRMLDDNDGAALLASIDGQVLAATPSAPVEPGGSVATLPVFNRSAHDPDQGSYRGIGLRGPGQLVAYRAQRLRPMVVLVELAEAGALSVWWSNARWLLAAAAAATLVIAAMTGVAVRSLRAREQARRQRDMALADAAQRGRELAVIVKSVQELIFRTDPAGRLTFVNARWQAASGQPPESLLGRSLAELVVPASRAAAAGLFAPAVDGGRHALVALDGGPARHFDLAVTPLLDGGRIVGFAGSGIDITERLAAQAQLQEQFAFSALLLDTMPLPVSLLDREGRYVTVNRAWEDFTGRSRAAVIGTRAQARVSPEEHERHRPHDERLLREGGQVRYDAEATHHDGSRRMLAITKAAVAGADGSPGGVLVTFMDISEFREAELATREARDAAEEASRAKSEFIANISHELRTPLQSIIGFSELGLVRGRAQEKLAAMFGDIHAAGQRMLALVNDLLDVSKIESTVGTFHLERTDVRPLVRSVARELEPLLAARRLHIELALSEGPLVVKVDPLRFQQVMRNVLANAMKFSPGDAAIEVTGDIDGENQVFIAVRDHGPGIPPTELETIFEAFVQSSKTKDGSGGTGLGLAICRKIVEAHGGRIVAANARGGGSRFTITLPARGFSDTVT